MNKKLIVIGAGIAGLSAGIYAAESGFQVTILEKHSIPGGVCTSWRRKGYLFEGAIHWLSGSAPQSVFHKYWRETGALTDAVPIYNNDPYLYTRYEGTDVFLYRDIERLREHFVRVSPEDTKAIHKLCKDIAAYSALKAPEENEKGVTLKYPAAAPSIDGIVSILPALFRMSMHIKTPLGSYLKMFKHPGIRELIAQGFPPYMPTMPSLFSIAVQAQGDGGYPEGGSLPLTARMAERFGSLGGTVIYGTEVEKVLVADGAVQGVSVAGQRIDADAVIIANDTLTAVSRLFDTVPADGWITDLKRNNTEVCNCTFAGIGVRADLSTLPHAIVIKPEHALDVGGEQLSSIMINNYGAYSGYAPEGGTALTAILGCTDTYDFWLRAKNSGVYEDEKQKLARNLETILGTALPHTKGTIDLIDIATPLTYERYTGSYHGSWMSRITVNSKMKKYPCTLKHIRNVYFAGFRTDFPGGLPGALVSGRRAAQLVCRDFDAVFQNLV
jgi:phytoene dehydrogenase-like protein